MLDKETILAFKRDLVPHDPPVLSLYVNVDPTDTDNRPKASVLRARQALESIEMPDKLRTEVLRKLDQELVIPAGRSLILFATEGPKPIFTVYYMYSVLPLLAHENSGSPQDGAIARYGTPYVSPMLFAIDQAERYAAFYVSRNYVRVFEVFLGEVRENWSSERDTETGGWERAPDSRTDGGHRSTGTRGGRNVDRFEARVEIYTARFYQDVITDFQNDRLNEDANRILILGTPDATKAFVGELPSELADRVVAQVPAPSDDSKSATQWFPLMADAIRKAEDDGEQQLLDDIRERGSVGMSEVLNMMNSGQIHMLALPYAVDNHVWISSETRTVGANISALETQRPGEEYEEVRLTDVLPELVRLHNFKVEFMDGAQAEELQNSFAGIAALRRW